MYWIWFLFWVFMMVALDYLFVGAVDWQWLKGGFGFALFWFVLREGAMR